MSKTLLRKWGNSQGVLIPKSTVEESGLTLGDVLDIAVDPEGNIVLRPEKVRFSRRRRVTIEELFADYTEEYQPAEPDWGEPQGQEMW